MEKRIIGFRNMVANANDFKYLALRLIETGRNKFGDKIYGTQFFVNGGFSIELYFKAIMKYENKNIAKSHELNKLFEALNTGTKEYLKKEFSNEFNNYMNKEKNELLKDEFSDNLVDYLNKEKNVFENWRYCYEQGCLMGSIVHMKIILNILEKYCSGLVKELDSNE